MNLGVDIRILGRRRAVSRYTAGLLKAIARLKPEIKLYLFTESKEKTALLSLPEGSFKEVLVEPRITIRDHFLFKKDLEKYPLDVFFHPDNREFLFCHKNSVTTVHDLIPWVLPDLVLGSDPLTNLRQRVYLEMQKRALLKSAKRILTVSNASREDIVKVLGVDPDLITVTYEGVDNTFQPVVDKLQLQQTLKKYNLPEEYLFYIGGLDERKNLLRLIHAFSKIAESRKIFLVIGGRTDTTDLEGRNSFLTLKKEIEKLGLQSLVIFPGFILENDLPAIYSQAKVFVYPSYYEGFGLPPLEAMACGVPVITSNCSSLPEVCGKAALLFNPYETKALVAAISLMIDDEQLRNEYRQAGFQRVKHFSWESVAAKTIEVFESL